MPMTPEELLEFEEDTQRGKYLTFILAKEVYAIEIKFVTEIIGIQPITKIPDLPPYIKGIINLRGKIISVMDVRLRFKKKPIEYNDRTCIVVVKVEEITMGLIVDSVSEVLRISDENVVPPPDLHNSIENRYLKGIGKVGSDVILILDCNKLMQNDDVDMVGIIA
ncbi:MAG: chemotaxis protein CheW [Eubacteriales bacterium]|nr:chemotaxis protein CheW [Eubacteriales bacterium]